MAFKPSNLANATPQFLVDELGGVRAKIKELQKEEGFLKEALKARVDETDTVVEGDLYAATIEQVFQMRFDSERTKLEMGPEWWAERQKEISFVTIKTVKRRDV